MSCDNWTILQREYQHKYNTLYTEEKTGEIYRFFGLTEAEDDYYYCMIRVSDGKPLFLSCVGHIENFGFQPVVNEKD